MGKKAFLTFALCLFSINAHAQGMTLGQIMDAAKSQCRAGEIPSQPSTDPQFCDCWVNTWVKMWTDDDYTTLQSTAQVTPHMQAIEAPAARQCGG